MSHGSNAFDDISTEPVGNDRHRGCAAFDDEEINHCLQIAGNGRKGLGEASTYPSPAMTASSNPWGGHDGDRPTLEKSLRMAGEPMTLV